MERELIERMKSNFVGGLNKTRNEGFDENKVIRKVTARETCGVGFVKSFVNRLF